MSRPVQAIALVFVGVLLGLVVAAFFVRDSADPDRAALLQGLGAGLAMALSGALAITRLGKGAWRHSLGGSPNLRWILLAPIVGIATCLLSFAYVEAILALFDTSGDQAARDGQNTLVQVSRLTQVVTLVLFAPMFEEWVCRGVLWVAITKISGVTTTIVATALVFAFLHGLGGWALLEVPHRLLAGLGFGLCAPSHEACCPVSSPTPPITGSS